MSAFGKETKEYSVRKNLTLVIENLRMAKVVVEPGRPGQAQVRLSGVQDLLDQIQVKQEAEDRIVIRGKGNGNSTTIISDGAATVISGSGTFFSFGGGKFNISNNGSVESMVIGNNVSMTQNFDGSGQMTVINQSELPTIEVIVPQGTTLDIGDVKSLSSQGVNGNLNITSGHNSQVEVEGAQDVMAVCSSQSCCKITRATGNLQVSISGQSSVHVNGSLGAINANVSGQSKFMAKGSCTQAMLIATGQSMIGFMSKCSKVTKRTSGQSDIADFND